MNQFAQYTRTSSSQRQTRLIRGNAFYLLLLDLALMTPLLAQNHLLQRRWYWHDEAGQ
ncbi:uncharacterized protein METZ01_LOCUS169045 [marine metagenome]|uniref:Uncharacterized protein n=1 Tax=marine metagenome TaxID=408172 RepID=A0A382BRN7_9ZZZZ